MLETFAKQHNIKLYIPPMVVCLDNGLIIADLGLKQFLYQKPMTLEQTIINPKYRTDEPYINWK
jgi:tRNA A37 threonylcarbamoyltransferase TsaD